MKLALIAYSCEPDRGSEPGVAWDFVAEMSRRGHEVVVFTKDDKRDVLEKHALSRKVKFHYVASPRVPLKSKFVPLRILHYYLWNLACVLYVRKRYAGADFDVIHHVTFVNDWTPSAGAFVGGCFVLGPVGRHPNLPLVYLRWVGVSAVIRELTRRLLRSVAAKIDLLTRLTHLRAKTIFVINEESIQSRFQAKTYVLPAIAVDPDRFGSDPFERKGDDPLRLYWAGKFIYWKAPEMAIVAFLKAKELVPTLELHMFGAGGEFGRIRDKYHTVKGVFFYGRVTQLELFRRVRRMDVFLYPSFEGGGMVVLEALGAGKPVVGIRFGGLAQMVTAECGRLVDFVDFERTSEDLAKEIVDLAGSPELLARLSHGARTRVRHFSVRAKCDAVERIAYSAGQND